jgi:hypothetical protein
VHDASDAFGKTRQRNRWSLGHGVFVLVLAIGLGVAVAALAIVINYRLNYAPLCVPSSPPLAHLSERELQQLRADLAGVTIRAGGRVYSSGTVPPDVVWNDEPPTGGSLALSRERLGPAGYEIRQWAPAGDVVGDMFQFATASQARRFFDEASRTSCHRSSAERPAEGPPQARNLVWFNPDGYTQQDVFLQRGPVVYRIAIVTDGAKHTPRPGDRRQIAFSTVDRLACKIAGSECPRLNALLRFREAASDAVCVFVGELASRYGERGPFALFPTRRKTQAIVATGIQRLRAITPPRARVTTYRAFLGALEGLLALGSKWNAARAAEEPAKARAYFERAPVYQSEFASLGHALGAYECNPIASRR